MIRVGGGFRGPDDATARFPAGVRSFGKLRFTNAKDEPIDRSGKAQCRALATLCRAGKVDV
jgi:hypothetical protein